MINKKIGVIASGLLFISINSESVTHAISLVPSSIVVSATSAEGNAPASIPLDGIFQVPNKSNSYTEGNNVIITKNEKTQTGSIFSTENNKLDLKKDFVSEMYLYIDGEADGIAFVMHNDPDKTKEFVGLKGNGLGIYGEKINLSNQTVGTNQLKNSFAIEFDTYHNGDNYDGDVKANNGKGHIAYSFPDKASTYVYNQNGKITKVNHLGLQYPSFKIGDGQWRLLKVNWTTWDDSGVGTLTYKYGDLDEITVKIPKTTFGTDDVYWGFNGSTGGYSEKAVVAFKTVPELVYYDDKITYKRNSGEIATEFTRNSEVVVNYDGIYTGGKQKLIDPTYTFTLTDNQAYEAGTFLINGEKVTPIIDGNQLTVKLNKNLSLDDPKVSIQFKVKNKNVTIGQSLEVGVTTKAKNAILDNNASYTIRKDLMPPKVTPKIIQAELNDENVLKDDNARNGIGTVDDEGASLDDMTYSFVTSQEDRQKMVKKLGVYDVDIKVTNAEGYSTVTTAPVIVHSPGETITDGFVIGNDFSIDYRKWNNATSSEKQAFLKDFGEIKGYSISDNTVTDVTDDPVRLNIAIEDQSWVAGETYEIPIKVNSYTKKIKVTLIPSEVKKTVKQVYAGTQEPIYSDLKSKKTVNNDNLSGDATIGDSITDIIQKHIDNKELNLNYPGYDDTDITNYKIYQNGKEVTPTPTTVPDDDFTIVYEYTGRLAFEKVAENLKFGTIEINATESNTPLIDGSEKDISIINTVQNNTWKLKAKLSDGIHQNNSDGKPFLGRILYKTNQETQEIGNSASIIKKQTDASLFSEISLKDSNNNGLYLQQEGGNLQGTYLGKLIWTLEDTP